MVDKIVYLHVPREVTELVGEAVAAVCEPGAEVRLRLEGKLLPEVVPPILQGNRRGSLPPAAGKHRHDPRETALQGHLVQHLVGDHPVLAGLRRPSLDSSPLLSSLEGLSDEELLLAQLR